MKRPNFSLMAVAAVLALTLVGLSGLLGMPTTAQNVRNEQREIDLRSKLKDKKFDDGRRIEIHALDTGEKIWAEIKNGQFVNFFMQNSDGTEVKGEFNKKHATTTQTATCTQTIVVTKTTTVNGQTVTTRYTSTILIPCPATIPGIAS